MRLYKNLLADFEEMTMGYSAIGIIASSCLGSIAAMFILMNGHSLVNMIQLFVVVIACMGFNTTILAQLKSKIIFNSLLLSLLISLIFIVINLF